MSDEQQGGMGITEPVLSAADLQRKIREAEQEASNLEAKLQDFSQYESDNGFDSRRYKRDELRYQQVNRELGRMYSQQGQVERRSDQWVDYAKRKAADFVRGRLPHFPERIRQSIQKEFLASFRDTVGTGVFERSDTQNEDAITHIIRDRFEYAVGRAFSQDYSSKGQDGEQGEDGNPPSERGLDQEQENTGEPPEDDWSDGDGLAKDLFSQWESQKNKKGMTLADQQRERLQKIRELAQNRQGGEAQ